MKELLLILKLKEIKIKKENKEMKIKHWLRLDIGDGWQMVVPNNDTEPHTTQALAKEVELADIMCPCKPRVDMESRIIIHNSFDNRELEELKT